MKKLTNTTIAIVITGFILALSACGDSGGTAMSRLGLTLEGPSRATMDNGPTVIVSPEPESNDPLVAICLRIDTTNVKEEQSAAGYGSLLGRLYGLNNENPLPAQLKAAGSSLGVEVQHDGILLSTTVLNDDAEMALNGLVSLLSLEFSEKAVLDTREELLQNLKSNQGNQSVKQAELIQKTLQTDRARAETSEIREQALSSMTPESFATWMNSVRSPQNVSLAVVGRLDNKMLDSALSELLNMEGTTIKSDEETAPQEEDAEEQENADFVPMQLLPSNDERASLFFVRRLPENAFADYYAITAVNTILNGTSTVGRLARTELEFAGEGSIASRVDLRKSASSHVIYARIPAQKAGDAFEGIVSQMRRLYEGKVLNARLVEQEVTDAKLNLKSSLRANTETRSELSRFLIWSDKMGFDALWPSEHLALIESIDRTSLIRAVELYFVPGINSLLAVGPEQVLGSQLRKYGELQVVQ